MDEYGTTKAPKAMRWFVRHPRNHLHFTATGGRGSYHMEYSHYDEVPAHLQMKTIATANAERAGVEVEEV